MTTVGKVVRRGWALFALPTVLCFAVFFVVPLAMGIYLSFTSFRTVTDAKWVGLKNYVDALSDPEFGAALWRSVLFTIVTTIITARCSSCRTSSAASCWAISGSCC